MKHVESLFSLLLSSMDKIPRLFQHWKWERGLLLCLFTAEGLWRSIKPRERLAPATFALSCRIWDFLGWNRKEGDERRERKKKAQRRKAWAISLTSSHYITPPPPPPDVFFLSFPFLISIQLFKYWDTRHSVIDCSLVIVILHHHCYYNYHHYFSPPFLIPNSPLSSHPRVRHHLLSLYTLYSSRTSTEAPTHK